MLNAPDEVEHCADLFRRVQVINRPDVTEAHGRPLQPCDGAPQVTVMQVDGGPCDVVCVRRLFWPVGVRVAARKKFVERVAALLIFVVGHKIPP